MKSEEAIKILRERIDIIKQDWSLVEYQKSLERAVKALEKQIPRKVLYEDVGFDCHHDVNLYACICPSCGLHIIGFQTAMLILNVTVITQKICLIPVWYIMRISS